MRFDDQGPAPVDTKVFKRTRKYLMGTGCLFDLQSSDMLLPDDLPFVIVKEDGVTLDSANGPVTCNRSFSSRSKHYRK